MPADLGSETRLNRTVLELSTLYEISKILGSSLDLQGELAAVLRLLSQFVGLKMAMLTLYDPETHELAIDEAHGLSEEEKSRGRYKMGEGVVGQVMKTGIPYAARDVRNDPLFLGRTGTHLGLPEEGAVAFISVPVRVQGEVVGVLSAYRSAGLEPSVEEDLRFLKIVAQNIGQTLRFYRLIVTQQKRLADENRELKSALKQRSGFDRIVGSHKKMQEVYRTIEHVAGTRSTVLLLGESGTGKELVARAIHFNSPRADKPFVKVDCASLAESLLDSELFGHERGAFTGAVADRKGRFEMADGGTIFLDEIGNVGPAVQAKLLRVLQDREFERVGGSRTLTADVRIIAATNRDLEAAVRTGAFREDLYYRLHVVPIVLPPLRDRAEDIPLLVDTFLQKFAAETGKPVAGIAPVVLDALTSYRWPGNVRELEHAIERMVIMSRSTVLDVKDLPPSLRSVSRSPFIPAGTMTEAVRKVERGMIVQALEEAGWVKARAAKRLGVTVRILAYKMGKFGIGERGGEKDAGARHQARPS